MSLPFSSRFPLRLPQSRNGRIALALGVVYLVWGSTYLAIRYAVETIPPLITAGIRHTFAGGILMAWALVRGYRPRREHWIAGDTQCPGRALDECRKGGVNLAGRARVEDHDLLPCLARCRLHFARLAWRVYIVWIDEHGNDRGSGHQLAHKLKP